MPEWKNTCDVWWWLSNHPIFFDRYSLSMFQPCLDIEWAMVDPGSRRIEKDQSRNTHVECWLECGPYIVKEPDKDDPTGDSVSHDWDLDCGGDTFEEALKRLAEKVLEKYGDYPDHDC
jgi:hypothetical protein